MRDLARRSLLGVISAAPATIVAAALPLPVLAHPADDQAIAVLAQRIARLTTLDSVAANRFAEAWDVQAADPEGFARAERLADWTQERVVRAGTAITLTQPQSMAGVVAKAEAFQAIQKSGWKHCAAGWRDDLAASIAADVLRIGAA